MCGGPVASSASKSSPSQVANAQPTPAGCWFALVLILTSALAGAFLCSLVYPHVARLFGMLGP